VSCIGAEATSVRPGEVNIRCHFFLSFVKTSSIRICRATVSVLCGCLILGISQLLCQTTGWKGITDMNEMKGGESKSALQAK